MKLKYIFLSAAMAATLTACEDVFEPELENIPNVDLLKSDLKYASGLVTYGYAMLPYSNNSENDVATDDAVTNVKGSSYSSMALGSWNSNNDPMQQWQTRKAAIQYLNTFLSISPEVRWAKNNITNPMFTDRYNGEAYALRALNYMFLLQAHGGEAANGEMLGVPLLTEPEAATSDFNVPRASFDACLQQVYSDLDAAISLLPEDYEDLKNGEESMIPQKYRDNGAEIGEYNTVFGKEFKGRISGRIAKAFKAQMALIAASPAFNKGNDMQKWETAAKLAADVLNANGGMSGFDMDGADWYNHSDEIDNLKQGDNPKEVLWRGNYSIGTESWDIGITAEANNFPPSLYGAGQVNPTQNLVDAFPMLNGYPITDVENSGYDEEFPYDGRDPRLEKYIIYDGATFKGKTIKTGNYGDSDDNINKVAKSTRTGYYMRKMLREDCNPDANNKVAKRHIPVRIRYTELFLIYAEAANEVWGPKGNGGNGYSAYDVIMKIRQRAGINDGVTDEYLEECAASKEKMRELIRNERRIELCFENKRFWDIRRWNDTDALRKTAKGVNISQENGTTTYTEIDVEERKYEDYMIYGPIPYSETIKYDALLQNKGW